MKQNGFFVKLTASVLLFTFSYTQLLMAADVRQMLLDAKTFFDEQDAQRPHGMAASDLEVAQTQQETVVAQEQMLQDFQNTAFSLTTPNGDVLKYVGDKLSAVDRPDGTKLANITTDAAGNILNADLKLSDGSIQIYQSGAVVGYQTPDGSQVFYTNGVVSKVISKSGMETLYTYVKDAQGDVIETILDNPQYLTKYDADQKIKEATRKSDNQKIYYSNGIIQKIVNADGSQTLFDSALLNGDTVVTPQGGASDVYIDAQGNKFYFTSGSVSKITLTDGSNVESITWDASNKIDSANLTEADGSKHIYQAKRLTRSYDVAGVVTNYTYNPTNIQAVKAGETWEYLLDKTPVKYTSLTGDVTTYLTSGVYKGLKGAEVLSTGVKYIYEYQGSGSSITVQRREVVSTTYNTTTFDGQTVNAQSTNPVFRTTVQFPTDGTIDQSVVITAVYSTTKNLRLNLVSGTSSTYTWNGATASLGITLNKGTDYKVELKWETSGVGIYVYAASAVKPATPTKTVADRAWDPKFKAVANNAAMTYDGTSSGYYNQNFDSREKSWGLLSGSPAMVMDFRQLATSYKTVSLKATQAQSGNIRRTITLYNDTAGLWTFKTSDYNTTTATTATTTSTLSKPFLAGKDYVLDMRLEGTKLNLYLYDKGLTRPATPIVSLAAFAVSTSLEAHFLSGIGKAAQLKNLTTPAYSSAFWAMALTSRVDTLQGSSIVRPAAPSSVNATDFTSITYDASAALKQVLFKDGSKLIFSQGVLTQAFDAAGKSTSFNFEQSGLSNIVGSSIVQSNLTSTYSAEGKLSSIKTGELTLHYKADGSSVDWIEKTDGTELWDLVFDTAGALTGASIYAPTGEIRTYAGGKLINLRQADQSQLFYANDKVTQMITPEKLTYNFDYTSPSIIQATLAGTSPVDTLTPIKMEYDTNFNLKKVTRQNQEILNYLNTDLVQIDVPSAAPKVFSYQKDAAGEVLSYTVTQGNVVTYYDANNQPTRALISPDANNPNTLDITYQYGKIRQIKKNSVVTFNYSYSFEADGTELTLVDDVEENATKTYKGGDLASSLDKTTNVLSSYEYTSAKVSKVTVTRFGRLLHTYDYSYSGTDTVVQDEAGIIRTYDANKKLTLLEKNGEKFAYTYSTQTVTTPGTPVITETLLPNSLYLTSARSVRPWDGQPAWYSYEQPYGKDYLVTHWWDSWVEYTVNMSTSGDLSINLQATDPDTIPSGYPNFLADFLVDGSLKGTMSIPAAASNAWKDGTLTLTGLSQGSHVVRLKFANYLSNAGGKTDFKFRNIAFKQVVTTNTTTMQQVEVVSEDLTERKLSDGSVAYYQNGVMDRIKLPDGTILTGVIAQPADPGQPGTTTLTKTLADGSTLEYTNGELTKRTFVDGKVTVYTYQKNTAGSLQTITLTAASGVKMVYSAADLKLQSVQAGSETFTVTRNVDAQGVITGYMLTAPSGSYAFAAGDEISFYSTYISKQRGSSVSEILVPAAASEITPTYFGTGVDGTQVITGALSLTKDMNYTNLTIDTGAVLKTNGYKIYITGNFVNRGTLSAAGGDGGVGANGSVSGTPPGGTAGTLAYSTGGTLFSGAAGVAGDIGRTWINSGYQGGAPGVSVSPSFGGSGGVGGSGGGRADGQAGNGPYGAGVATDPLFALTPGLFNSTQLNTIYGGASGSSGAGGGAQASLGGKGGAGGGSGAGGGIVFIYAKNLDNSQGTISADGGKGGRGGDGSGVEAGAGGGGAGGGGGAVILVSNNFQKGTISTVGGQGGAHGTPSGGTMGSDGNPGQPGSVYVYRNDASQGQIKISTLVPYWDPALSAIYQTNSAAIVEASDNGVVVQNAYATDGKLEAQKKADGSTTLFQNEKPITLVDKNGKAFVQYFYDSSGNPTRVYLKNARDALSDEIAKIRLNIETQRSSTLHDLAQQNNLAYQSIEAQFQDVINTIKGAIQSEQARRAGFETYNGRPANWVELYYIDKNIADLQAQLASVYTQQADAYENLGSQVGVVSSQIEADTVLAMNELATQKAKLEKEILRQEAAPIVYDNYRRVLGRDPGTAEYDSWISQIDYASGNAAAEVKTTGGVNLTTAISNYLNALPELAERQAYVAAIKLAVTNQINSYLEMTQVQKEAFAATLGLAPQDTAPISSEDAAKILNWINTRSLHFGQSAFLALESLLDQKGKVYTRETLARQAILIDILSGVISPLDDGDLVISVYSLNKTGKLYGVDLNGAHLSWDDLKALVPSSATTSSARVVAHINGNHFVIVTAMTDTSITYIDPGIGKDKQNESRTISKADFLKAWKGNVLVEQVLLNQVPNSAQKVLSKDEQKNIRGAFFPFLAAVFVAIFTTVAAVVTAVVSAIAALLTTIGALVANIVGTIGGFLQGLGQALGHLGSSLFAGIKGAIGSILGVLPSPVATTAGQTLTSHLTFATFGEAAFKAAITTGFSIATTKGLESLGVNSTIAGLAGAFVTGGITGGFKAGFNAQNFIQSGIKGLALQGSQTVMQNAGLDTSLSQALSLLTSPLIDGIRVGNIGAEFVKIIPDVAKNLTFYGVEKIGASLGIDSRFTGLIAAPLSGALGASLAGGVNVGQNVINAINLGLQQGATSLGIEYLTQQAGLDPLLGALTSRAITGAIAGALNGGDVFGGIFQAFRDSALNVARLGISGNDPWSQAQYMQRVINFSSTIQSKGLSQAIEDYAAGILHADSVSSILQSFATVKAYVDDQIARNQATTVTIDGVNYKKMDMKNGNYVMYTADFKTVVEVKQGNRILKGTFGTDEKNNWGLATGTIADYDAQGKLQTKQLIESGQLIQVDIYDKNQTVQFVIKKSHDQNGIIIDENGEYQSAIIQDTQNGMEYEISNGNVIYGTINSLTNFDTASINYSADPLKNNLQNAEALVDDMIDDINLSLSGTEIFGESPFAVMKSIMMTSAKYELKYGESIKALMSSLSEEEAPSYLAYAQLKFQDLMTYQKNSTLVTADEMQDWEVLKSGFGPAGSFRLVAVHGTLPASDGWASYMDGVLVNGQRIISSSKSWNQPGDLDGYKDGLSEYWTDIVKRKEVVRIIKEELIKGWLKSQADGIPFDVVAHSLGTVGTYEAISELSVEAPEIHVRNLYFLGAPLRLFLDNNKAVYNAHAFDNVGNVVNIYNKYDIVLNVPQKFLINEYVRGNPLFRLLIQSQVDTTKALIKPVSGDLKDLFPDIKDVAVPISLQHQNMLNDPRMLEYIQENGEL